MTAATGSIYMKKMLGRNPSKTMVEQLAHIGMLQSRVSGLIYSNGALSARTGESLSRGDQANLAGRWTAIFVGKACDLECKFCPQPPKPAYADDVAATRNSTTSFHHSGSDQNAFDSFLLFFFHLNSGGRFLGDRDNRFDRSDLDLVWGDSWF